MAPSARQWILTLDGSSLPEKSLIGGKAWSLARMRTLGLPVPPAFVISTRACVAYLERKEFPDGLEAEIADGIAWLEAETQRHFDRADRPLLLSVRSGAAISMPGMMDTILNLGIDARTERALADETGQPAFAADTHRRFLQLYAAIVLKTPLDDLTDAGWREEIAAAQLAIPESGLERLHAAVRAVFDSWNTRRARKYREHHGIAHDLGTAVTIQAMVFGNLDERSGTGVIFSRNPLTGERVCYGEYLPRAQGEDVVSGRFTPLSLDALREREPAAHEALLAAAARLELENKDIQDIEFTVQSGTLFLLQTRSAKRAPGAAVRAAVEMVAEDLIDVETALQRVTPEQVQMLLQPRLRDGVADTAAVRARGEGACPGVGSGRVVFDPDEAERKAAADEAVVLVRATTSPDDIHGMIAARAVVTESGGSTSHAAVVSRALGRPCVVGIGAGAAFHAGDLVTVDGAAGVVYEGELAVVAPSESQDVHLTQLVAWTRQRSAVRVLRPDEAAGVEDCLDIDLKLPSGDGAQLPALLVGVKAASGKMLANPEMARIAAASGVTTLVTDPVLPALLAIVKASS